MVCSNRVLDRRFISLTVWVLLVYLAFIIAQQLGVVRSRTISDHALDQELSTNIGTT